MNVNSVTFRYASAAQILDLVQSVPTMSFVLTSSTHKRVQNVIVAEAPIGVLTLNALPHKIEFVSNVKPIAICRLGTKLLLFAIAMQGMKLTRPMTNAMLVRLASTRPPTPTTAFPARLVKQAKKLFPLP
jgi:hypothetical protein